MHFCSAGSYTEDNLRPRAGLCVPGVTQIAASVGKGSTTPAEVNGKSTSPCCHQLSTSSPSHLKGHSAWQHVSSLFLLARAASHYSWRWPWPSQVYRNTHHQKHVRDKKTFFMVYLVDHENIEFQHMDFKSKFPQVFIRRALRFPEIL